MTSSLQGASASRRHRAPSNESATPEQSAEETPSRSARAAGGSGERRGAALVGHSERNTFESAARGGAGATGSQAVSELLNKQPVQVASTSYLGEVQYGAGPGNRLIPVRNAEGKRSLSAAEASDAMAEAYGLGTPAQKNEFRKLGVFPQGSSVIHLPTGSFMPVELSAQNDATLKQAAAALKGGGAPASSARGEASAALAQSTRRSLAEGSYSANRQQLWNGLLAGGVNPEEAERLLKQNDQNVSKALTTIGEGLRSGGHFDNLSKEVPKLVESGYVTQRQGQEVLDRNWLNWVRNAHSSGDPSAPSRQVINDRGAELLARYEGKEKEQLKSEIEALKQLASQRSGGSTASASTARTPEQLEPKSQTDLLAEAWVGTVDEAREDAAALSTSNNPVLKAVGTTSGLILDGAAGVNTTIRTARETYAALSESDNALVSNAAKVGGVLTELGGGVASIATYGAPGQKPEEAKANTLGAALNLATMGAAPVGSAVVNSAAGKAVIAGADDALRLASNSSVGQAAGKLLTAAADTQVGQSIARSAPGMLQATGENLTRLNQLPDELLGKVRLPGGGNMATAVNETGAALNSLNHFGKAPATNAVAAAPTTQAAGGERPAFEGFRYRGAAGSDEFTVIGRKAAEAGMKSEWDIKHPQWVRTVAADISTQRLNPGDIMPLPQGVRPSAGDLAAVTKATGHEVALSFKPSPSGSGPGAYFVHVGDTGSVALDLSDGRIILSHTHPTGTHLPIDAWPSSADLNLPVNYGSRIFGADGSHTFFKTRMQLFEEDLDGWLGD